VTSKQLELWLNQRIVDLMVETGRLYVSEDLWAMLKPAELAKWKADGLEIVPVNYLPPGTVLAAKPLRLPFGLGVLWPD
jgi:hypothetical protein